MSEARRLTPKEREAAKWLVLGKSRIEIGLIMGISEHTVRDHHKSGMEKLGANNVASYAFKLALYGEITPTEAFQLGVQALQAAGRLALIAMLCLTTLVGHPDGRRTVRQQGRLSSNAMAKRKQEELTDNFLFDPERSRLV